MPKSGYNLSVVLAFFKSEGLPEPVPEFCFACPERKFRFDLSWPVLKVAIEIEGGVWIRGAHGRGSGIVRDMEKYNLATVLGWRVLRVQPKELCMVQTTDMIKKVMGL